jgi:hypothetical protein
MMTVSRASRKVTRKMGTEKTSGILDLVPEPTSSCLYSVVAERGRFGGEKREEVI